MSNKDGRKPTRIEEEFAYEEIGIKDKNDVGEVMLKIGEFLKKWADENKSKL